MINSPYINKHGTLNAKLADGVAENAPLWSVEYLLLKHDTELFDSLMNYIHKCQTETPGLYNQYPTIHNTHEDYMSPDQLIAFVAAFKMAKLDNHIKSIWKYLKDHWGTYDNLTGTTNWQRMMQVSALAFTGVCAGSWWLKPVLSAVCMYSCATNKDQTSGKLKAWTMFKTLDMKWTEKACTYLISRSSFKTWKQQFYEYFQESGHPIRGVI